jgi:hypothetical protein
MLFVAVLIFYFTLPFDFCGDLLRLLLRCFFAASLLGAISSCGGSIDAGVLEVRSGLPTALPGAWRRWFTIGTSACCGSCASSLPIV